MSRCTTPALCKYSTAPSSCRKYPLALTSGMRSSEARLLMSITGFPSSSSTIKTRSSEGSSITSISSTTLGCRNLRRISSSDLHHERRLEYKAGRGVGGKGGAWSSSEGYPLQASQPAVLLLLPFGKGALPSHSTLRDAFDRYIVSTFSSRSTHGAERALPELADHSVPAHVAESRATGVVSPCPCRRSSAPRVSVLGPQHGGEGRTPRVIKSAFSQRGWSGSG